MQQEIVETTLSPPGLVLLGLCVKVYGFFLLLLSLKYFWTSASCSTIFGGGGGKQFRLFNSNGVGSLGSSPKRAWVCFQSPFALGS